MSSFLNEGLEAVKQSDEQSSGLLVQQSQGEISVGDINLNIVCSSYADRHFIIITQLDKIGTLVSGKTIVGVDGSVHYEVNTIFGKRDDQLLLVYCRQIIERMYTNHNSTKPVLLAISILEDARGVECFQAVLNKLEEIRTW